MTGFDSAGTGDEFIGDDSGDTGLGDDALDAPIEDELEDRDEQLELEDTEPGTGGPVGTGIEGADDALEADREDPAGPDQIAEESLRDWQTAAEQGNRPGDEMVSEGDDVNEVIDLDGDDEDVDAIGYENLE